MFVFVFFSMEKGCVLLKISTMVLNYSAKFSINWVETHVRCRCKTHECTTKDSSPLVQKFASELLRSVKKLGMMKSKVLNVDIYGNTVPNLV